MQRVSHIVAVAVVLFSATALHAAFDPSRAAADYAALQKWQYATAPIAITTPVTISRDTATWTLTSGSVYLTEPVGGHATGIVFEGTGRFTMSVPDPNELAQLRRFAEKPQMQTIDEPFSQLVLRVSGDEIDKRFPGPAKPPFARNAIAESRLKQWLIDLRTDIDARIIAAGANPNALEMMAAMKTATFDWLTFDYDSSRDEEIHLIHFSHAQPEVWLSLDRAEDRTSDGMPGKRASRDVSLNHIDVTADLTHHRLTSDRIGETDQLQINGHYVVAETITSSAAGIQAVVFELDPTAQNLAVRDAGGHPLTVLRDHIGTRGSSVPNKLWDSTPTVILPAALKSGEKTQLTFEYDLETSNYALGNTWYPTIPGAFDMHTGRLALTVAKKNAVRSMGLRDKEIDGGTTTTSIWLIDKPTTMITFVTAERFNEETVEAPGLPKVVSFGWTSGSDVRTRLRNTAADVANSLQYFGSLFGEPIEGQTFYVTSITGDHGQAFDGFLQLAEGAYSEHPGATELFRAHEVAHEWFGHRVGWRTYRDQWLSEALAEYAAMMFVQSTVKDGTKYFDEIIHAYDSTMKGGINAAFSKFYRSWFTTSTAAERARIGPIGLGYRASTGDLPTGYLVQTYVKGPLVVNMLREILRARTHSDDVFVSILRDYIHDYSGKLATTEDFERVVERDSQTDFKWFFKDWVYGAEIPTIRWSYQVAPSGSGYKLNLTVKRSDVSSDFVVVAPVRVDFDGGKSGTFFAVVKNDEQTITRDLPMKPRDVVFAPGQSLLGNVRRE
jgi:peptidase M1-like protein